MGSGGGAATAVGATAAAVWAAAVASTGWGSRMGSMVSCSGANCGSPPLSLSISLSLASLVPGVTSAEFGIDSELYNFLFFIYKTPVVYKFSKLICRSPTESRLRNADKKKLRGRQVIEHTRINRSTNNAWQLL